MRFVLYCFVLFTFTVFAQIDSLESLQLRLKGTLTSEERIDVLNRLSRIYSESSLTVAEQTASNALQLAESIRYHNGIATSYNNLGVFAAIRGQHTISMDYFVKALEMREQLKDPVGISRTLSNMSRLYVYQKNFDKALEYANKSLAELEQVDDQEAMGSAYLVLGTIYMDKKDYTIALQMLSQARDLFKNKKLGAKEGSALITIASIHELQGNYIAALDACVLAADLLKEDTDAFVSIELYQRMGSVYGKMKQEKGASLHLHRALLMADKRGDGNGKLSARLELSDLYKTFGRFDSALFYKDKYLSLYDTIFNAEKSRQLTLLEKIYQTERKDRMLEVNSNQIRMQSMIIVVIGVMLVILSVVGFVVYRFYLHKKRFARELELLNKEIYDKHEEMLTQAEELSEANDKIKSINENLELEVSQRALRIQRQNEKLIDYAYSNAHNVRGPLARILGLTYLMTNEASMKVIKEYNLHLSVSAQELDQVVRQINIKLQVEE